MDQPEPMQIRVSSPGDIAQLVPYLVGFTPEESLVVSAIEGGRVQVTARVDLAEVTAPGRLEDLLDRIWSRFPGAEATAVVYTADHQTGWETLIRCEDTLPHGCLSMLIDGDTWHLLDGTTGTVDRYGETAVQAAVAGLRPLNRRTDLAAAFASPPDSDELDQRLGAALATLPPAQDKAAIVAFTAELLARNLPAREPGEAVPEARAGRAMPDADAIQLSVLAQHPAARDLALLSISRDNAPQHLQLWQQVVRASPAYGADMPLYLAGMAAWVSGDGASATIALERISDADPPPTDAHPARLLEGLIDQVVPPSAWESLRTAVRADVDPVARRALAAELRDRPADRAGWPPAPTATTARQTERNQRRPPAPRIGLQP
ncbi:MAG: DUF4192 domain-containing protein [Propionicimonas sp.]|uniref:DUF4192 domain-containing protein n=1 Tax=Propionicimonas sp. TaxID=1955623 RepID=UPI003D0A8768